MAAFCITARLIQGYFQGHHANGVAARGPDTARLHAALVHAAGTGVLATEVDGDLRPSEEARSALHWLESNPPNALAIPQVTALTGADALGIYRAEGVFHKEKSAHIYKKRFKAQSDGFAVDGPFGWLWDDGPPPEVRATIDALCADVACLGETETPAVLEVAPIAATHRVELGASAFAKPGGTRVRTPSVGRLDALDADYQRARPAKRPSEARDRNSWGAEPGSRRPTGEGLRELLYREIEAPLPDLPWNLAVALVPDRPVAEVDRVRWAVTAHRALCSILGDDAPPLVTGKYGDGARRPANRVAVQYVSGPTAREDLRNGAFLVTVPKEASAAEISVVTRATRSLARLTQRDAKPLALTRVGRVDLSEFWLPPLPGMTRRWRAIPAFVPEIRRVRSAPQWTLGDSALVALGHVYRDRLTLGRERSDARYRAIAEQVRGWGVEVGHARRIADPRVERYLHKINSDSVAQPIELEIDVSRLIGLTSFLAIGQSRHLGGGLLVPVDRVGGEPHAS